MTFGHIAIFATTFFLILRVVQMIPDFYTIYHERYQSRSRETARELNKFFINIKPKNIILGSAAVAVVLGLLSGSWVVSLAVASAGVFAPKIMLSVWKQIRSQQFETQLMDTLLLISNSLRSGLDIVAGIERVSTTMKPPISEEFGLVLNAYRLGTPIEAALMDLTRRINSRTLETVVYAINIQRETGGNIIKTFEQLVVTIRDESKLQNKVLAITSQGRTQIFFLAGFPWVLALIFYLMSPDFIQPALANSWGQLVILFLIVWEIIGIMITRKITAVDV